MCTLLITADDTPPRRWKTRRDGGPHLDGRRAWLGGGEDLSDLDAQLQEVFRIPPLWGQGEALFKQPPTRAAKGVEVWGVWDLRPGTRPFLPKAKSGQPLLRSVPLSWLRPSQSCSVSEVPCSVLPLPPYLSQALSLKLRALIQRLYP